MNSSVVHLCKVLNDTIIFVVVRHQWLVFIFNLKFLMIATEQIGAWDYHTLCPPRSTFQLFGGGGREDAVQ